MGFSFSCQRLPDKDSRRMGAPFLEQLSTYIIPYSRTDNHLLSWDQYVCGVSLAPPRTGCGPGIPGGSPLSLVLRIYPTARDTITGLLILDRERPNITYSRNAGAMASRASFLIAIAFRGLVWPSGAIDLFFLCYAAAWCRPQAASVVISSQFSRLSCGSTATQIECGPSPCAQL